MITTIVITQTLLYMTKFGKKTQSKAKNTKRMVLYV